MLMYFKKKTKKHASRQVKIQLFFMMSLVILNPSSTGVFSPRETEVGEKTKRLACLISCDVYCTLTAFDI
jgi:hypothetical protein